MASLPSKDFFRFFPILFFPYRFPTSAAAAPPWPPGEDAGKGKVPVPEPAPADAYCQHEHKVRSAQALVVLRDFFQMIYLKKRKWWVDLLWTDSLSREEREELGALR